VIALFIFTPNPSSPVAIVIPIDVEGLPYRARSLTGEASLTLGWTF